MKEKVASRGVKVPHFAPVENALDLIQFIEKHGYFFFFLILLLLGFGISSCLLNTYPFFIFRHNTKALLGIKLLLSPEKDMVQ